MPSKPTKAAEPEQSRTEFSPESLRAAAEALQDKAMTGCEVSIAVSIELRALAAHLRCLAAQAGGE